jgi:hypothetical protein
MSRQTRPSSLHRFADGARYNQYRGCSPDHRWWHEGVIYQIRARSFAEANEHVVAGLRDDWTACHVTYCRHSSRMVADCDAINRESWSSRLISCPTSPETVIRTADPPLNNESALSRTT